MHLFLREFKQENKKSRDCMLHTKEECLPIQMLAELNKFQRSISNLLLTYVKLVRFLESQLDFLIVLTLLMQYTR